MGIGVLIIGASGMGKSASMRNFKSNLSVINVLGKPLPFRSEGLKTVQTDDPDTIISLMNKSVSEAIVIDDSGYLISNYYMENKAPISAKMNDKYAVYDELATRFFKIVNSIKKLSPNKIIYIMMHEDLSDTGKIKPRTIGKMLDDKVCIEGYFSIVLRAEKNEGKYVFRTNTDGASVVKSPFELFPELIENDLFKVDQTIRAYYGLNKNQGEKNV
ncbi:MAG: AAA family ATPase [Termitinemataceae bacterium]|nr:MAG: AAA family ATPase [Termitinemataceae bacterium]